LADDIVTLMAEQATCPVIHSPGALDPEECELLTAIWHGYSPYRPSSDPHLENRAPVRTRQRESPPAPVSVHSTFEFATTFGPRFDAGRNFLRTGGRFSRKEKDADVSRSRTDYFRETYATRYLTFAPQIDFLFDHELTAAMATRLYGLPVIVPFVVYANLLLPGQELGLHTDVPEFRLPPGVLLPAWLRVVMCHSGLFERWRISVATVIVYVGHGTVGGGLAYFPDGTQGPAAVIQPGEGVAVALDADTMFHGVDRVGDESAGTPTVVPGSRLIHQGRGRWNLCGPDSSGRAVEEWYDSDVLRFSASWKACCFSNEADLMRWESHSDDLPAEQIIGPLVEELVSRGRIARGPHLTNDQLGSVLIDEFVRFPAPQTAKV
jgi:hypothetical protein